MAGHSQPAFRQKQTLSLLHFISFSSSPASDTDTTLSNPVAPVYHSQSILSAHPPASPPSLHTAPGKNNISKNLPGYRIFHETYPGHAGACRAIRGPSQAGHSSSGQGRHRADRAGHTQSCEPTIADSIAHSGAAVYSIAKASERFRLLTAPDPARTKNRPGRILRKENSLATPTPSATQAAKPVKCDFLATDQNGAKFPTISLETKLWAIQPCQKLFIRRWYFEDTERTKFF